MASHSSFLDEHEAFAASRVFQYVYVPTRDTFFAALDQHADTLEGDVKLPLILVGNEGMFVELQALHSLTFAVGNLNRFAFAKNDNEPLMQFFLIDCFFIFATFKIIQPL
jgi:hypothetical protein